MQIAKSEQQQRPCKQRLLLLTSKNGGAKIDRVRSKLGLGMAKIVVGVRVMVRVCVKVGCIGIGLTLG